MRELLKNTLTLSYKLNPGASEVASFPSELESLKGSELSFWVASLFEQAQEKQNILEITSVKDRLEREEEVLESTLNYLRAASAIKVSTLIRQRTWVCCSAYQMVVWTVGYYAK